MTTKEVNEDAQETAAGQTLQTKSAMMSGILAAIGSMTHEQMMQWWPDAMTLAGTITGDQALQNAQSIQMKPSAATPVQEDVAELFAGESLTETAQLKIGTLIEHAVDLRIAIEREQLQEEYNTRIVEETARIQEDLVEKVNTYATYAAEQWVAENQVAIESAMKVSRAQRLMEGLTRLVADCGLDIPDDQQTVVEQMQSRIDELETKLNETLETAVALRESLVSQTAMVIFNEVAEGLTPIQTEKFKKLVENIEADDEPESLRSKLTIIREAHFRGATPGTPAAISEGAAAGSVEEVLEEQTSVMETPITDPRVKAYAEAISRSSNRYSRGPYARS